MKILLVSSSTRSGSESRRITDELERRLHGRKIETVIVDLFETPFTTILDDVWGNVDGAGELVKSVSAEAESADGFIFVTPEWGGMASPALKVMLTSVSGLAHKPALIVSVSAGRSGSYPVTDLRSSSYKNTKVVYIPDHLILRKVNTLFKGDISADAYDSRRTDFSLNALLEYAQAMKPLRDIEALNVEEYAHGM